MATPSTCSYKFPWNWKSWFFVAISNSSIRLVFVMLRSYCLLNQSSLKAFSARISIVSSTGTFVKRDETSYDTKMSCLSIFSSPEGHQQTFMCHIEEKLKNQNNMPAFYKRYVDDTLSKMPDVSSASEFLLTLNGIHPSLSFTIELEDNSKLPFFGMVIIRNGPRLETKVYVKPTDTELSLHYQSHVDVKYKHSLLKTMLNRAFKLSSNWQFFYQECERLKMVFARLRYPETLI